MNGEQTKPRVAAYYQHFVLPVRRARLGLRGGAVSDRVINAWLALQTQKREIRLHWQTEFWHPRLWGVYLCRLCNMVAPDGFDVEHCPDV